MTGAARRLDRAQSATGLQSKSLGHSTLKEKLDLGRAAGRSPGRRRRRSPSAPGAADRASSRRSGRCGPTSTWSGAGSAANSACSAGGRRAAAARRRPGDPFDADVAHPLAALDAHLLGGEARRHRLQQADEQRALARAAGRRVVVEHLEVVDAVERRVRRRRRCGGARRSSDRSWRRPPLRSKRGRLLRLRAPDRVADASRGASSRRPRPRRPERDEVAEPLLERALDEELRGRGELGAVRREDELHQPAAEIRPHDALARRGEQHLLDRGRGCRPPRPLPPCGRGRRTGRG